MNHDIAPILRQLFGAYTNSQATVETIAVYDRQLVEIPPGELQAVVDQCIRECKFLPTVAELFERWHASKHTEDPTPAEGWESVEKAIRGVGCWGSPKFRDPLVKRVVDMMGWRNLCESDKPAVDRAQFMQMYSQLRERSQRDEKMTPEYRALVERNRSALLGGKIWIEAQETQDENTNDVPAIEESPTEKRAGHVELIRETDEERRERVRQLEARERRRGQ
jgi:hypothetical protein